MTDSPFYLRHSTVRGIISHLLHLRPTHQAWNGFAMPALDRLGFTPMMVNSESGQLKAKAVYEVEEGDSKGESKDVGTSILFDFKERQVTVASWLSSTHASDENKSVLVLSDWSKSGIASAETSWTAKFGSGPGLDVLRDIVSVMALPTDYRCDSQQWFK